MVYVEAVQEILAGHFSMTEEEIIRGTLSLCNNLFHSFYNVPDVSLECRPRRAACSNTHKKSIGSPSWPCQLGFSMNELNWVVIYHSSICKLLIVWANPYRIEEGCCG
jgi:hypothetical protein